MLLHMVDIVGRSKDFGLVDVVNANGFEDLTFTKRKRLCRLTTGENAALPGTQQSVRYEP
jgi:hypothetical protein